MDTIFVKVFAHERLPPLQDEAGANSKGWATPVNYSIDVPLYLSKEGRFTAAFFYKGTNRWVQVVDDLDLTLTSDDYWLEEVTVDEFIQRELKEEHTLEL